MKIGLVLSAMLLMVSCISQQKVTDKSDSVMRETASDAPKCSDDMDLKDVPRGTTIELIAPLVVRPKKRIFGNGPNDFNYDLTFVNGRMDQDSGMVQRYVRFDLGMSDFKNNEEFQDGILNPPHKFIIDRVEVVKVVFGHKYTLATFDPQDHSVPSQVILASTAAIDPRSTFTLGELKYNLGKRFKITCPQGYAQQESAKENRSPAQTGTGQIGSKALKFSSDKKTIFFEEEASVVHGKILDAMIAVKATGKCSPKPCDEDSGVEYSGKFSCYVGKQGRWCAVVNSQMTDKGILKFDSEQYIVQDRILESMRASKVVGKCSPKPCDEDSGVQYNGKISCYYGKQGRWCHFTK